MKIVLAAFIPVISAFLGFIFSARFKESSEFWDEFLSWHKKIKAEITFSQRSLPEIFNSTEKDDLFLSIAKGFFDTHTIYPKPTFLSKDEYTFLIKYLDSLGTTDKNSQLDFLNSMENELNDFKNAAEIKNKKFRPLYIKLGFLLGLIVFILIV